jgi:hypothetical protein
LRDESGFKISGDGIQVVEDWDIDGRIILK